MTPTPIRCMVCGRARSRLEFPVSLHVCRLCDPATAGWGRPAPGDTKRSERDRPAPAVLAELVGMDRADVLARCTSILEARIAAGPLRASLAHASAQAGVAAERERIHLLLADLSGQSPVLSGAA